MNADEEYVRSKWENVAIWKHSDGMLDIQLRHDLEFGSMADAKEYTIERERQIAEVEEEIALVKWLEQENHLDNEGAVCERILAVEQERLAALKQGMKQ